MALVAIKASKYRPCTAVNYILGAIYVRLTGSDHLDEKAMKMLLEI